MEDMDWVEDLDGLDDSEFFPSPSAAIASRIARGLRRGSSRKVVPTGARPGLAVSPPVRNELAKVYETMKRLEAKQEETTKALATLQSRSAGLQSADLFGLSLSNAIANAAGPAANKDWAAVLAQAAPLLQNAQGAAASFKAKPFSTLAFPIGALGLHAARKPRKVEFIVNDPRRTTGGAAAAVDVTVSLISPDGGVIRYEVGSTAINVTRSSKEYTGPIPIAAKSANNIVTAKAFFLVRSSEQESLTVQA